MPVPRKICTTPDHVVADKGYSSRKIRTYLRRRGIRHTITDRRDQAAGRQRRGYAGGRPPGFGQVIYRLRSVVERCFNRLKQ
jgi:transposase